MGKDNKMRTYLNRINPVIERLIVDLLVDMPEDFVIYINFFLQQSKKLDIGIAVSLLII